MPSYRPGVRGSFAILPETSLPVGHNLQVTKHKDQLRGPVLRIWFSPQTPLGRSSTLKKLWRPADYPRELQRYLPSVLRVAAGPAAASPVAGGADFESGHFWQSFSSTPRFLIRPKSDTSKLPGAWLAEEAPQRLLGDPGRPGRTCPRGCCPAGRSENFYRGAGLG